MLVRPDNAGDLATSDAFVRHSDPHVVACQHDLCQLGGFQSHLNGPIAHGFTFGQSSLQLFISKYIGTGSLSFSSGFWITVHDVSGHFSHLHRIV